MHWEEEVIGPVIFGNNYDPLQEVIINGEGKGRTGKEGTTVDSNCVCKEVAWKCAYPLLLHTHSVRANVLGPAWHSGLKNTALQASIWTQKASCACRKLMGFPTGNKKVQCLFFLLAENAWVSPPSLHTFRNRFCDWPRVGILGQDISWSQDLGFSRHLKSRAL